MTATTLDELAAKVEQLENRVYSLEAENQELRERNDELTERVDDLEAENDRLRDAVDELPEINMDGEDLSSFTVNGLPVGRKVSASVTDHSLEAELEALKDDLEASNPTPEGVDVDYQGPEIAETPLEQLVYAPNRLLEDELTENKYRAIQIAAELWDYSETAGQEDRRTGKDLRTRVIRPAQLRTVLSARFDQSHSQTVSRVRDFLNDLGKDQVHVEEVSENKYQKNEKKIVFEWDLAKRLKKLAEMDHDVVTEATA